MDANLSAASVLTLIKSYINFNSVYCSVLSSVSLYFFFFFWLVLLPWPVLQCFSLTCFVLPNLFLFSLTCVSLLSLCFLFCYCHGKVGINKYKGLTCDSCLILFINVYVHAYIMTSNLTSSYFPVMVDTCYHFFIFSFFHVTYKGSVINQLSLESSSGSTCVWDTNDHYITTRLLQLMIIQF